MKNVLKTFAVAVVLLIIAASSVSAIEYYNYAEALQLSMYFYDANKCGTNVTGGKLEWRGDCHTVDTAAPAPDGEGTIDVTGGYHDAGDFVKFGLPQMYTLGTLGWGYYEFKDSFVEIGEKEHILDLLKWGTDYLLKCTKLDETGKLKYFVYMVGEGSTDHIVWQPPELQRADKCPRPIDVASPDSPASEMTGGAAAALALMYLNYLEIDPVYAEKCLTYAKALYEFGKEYRGNGTGDGFYNSGPTEDELSWAAVWLYVATGDMEYIRHIDSYDQNGLFTGYMSEIIATTDNTWQNIWVHCWDVVWGGVFTKLATLFPENEDFNYYARWNMEYWTGGIVPHEDPADSNYLGLTPAGYAMINTWGSARYNTAAQLCMLVYAKYTDTDKAKALVDWAKGQMQYIMGNNPMDYAYIVGYGPKHATHPHHRASHGSKLNSMREPEDQVHTLWGALVGGPDADDMHVDVTWDYVYNEVAIDYNAAFVGAAAGHYYFSDKTTLPRENFPPLEGDSEPFYANARIESDGTDGLQSTIQIHNESIHPPRYENDIQCRYYFDISELVAVGQTIDNVTFKVMYDELAIKGESTTEVSGPIHVVDNVYYVNFSWKDAIWYGSLDLLFALTVDQAGDFTAHWDSSNDWSRPNITNEMNLSNYIPVYVNGELVYGEEFEYTAPAPTPTPNPGQTPEPPSVTLKAQYVCGEKMITTGQISPQLNIVNNGNVAVDLKDVTARYYYTKESGGGETIQFDYSIIDKTNIIGSIHDGYLEVGFTEGAGSIGAGFNTGVIQMRVNKVDHTNYDQSDDWSFDASFNAFGDHDKITLYYKGEKIWGDAPGEEPTPTPTPTPDPNLCDGIPGDVNGDGSCNIVDALLMARSSAGLVTITCNACTDVNGDGFCNIIDALLIAQASAGLITL